MDDIPANLGILANFLGEADFEVLVAQDAESAMQKLEYVIPDLILLDVMMPGDEFVILLETETGISVAQKLLEQFKLPFNFNGGYEAIIEASIGITSSAMGYQEPMDILRDVDIAMYRAKRRGSGNYQVFDPQMQTDAITRLELEQDLRKAIAQQEFCLYYQPIVSLLTEEIKGFEALIRWNHPEKGMIPPDEFIPIAEETGLINPLGWWILREVCNQLGRWQEQLPDVSLTMNVNFSPIQFRQVDLFEKIAEIVQQTDINKNTLNMEITESCLFKEANLDFDFLKNIGVGVCIDDFCTGYSSLNLLKDLPIDILKIDRSFLQNLNRNPNDTILMQTIILLGKNLNMEVVAEGFETQEQIDILKGLGCIFGQGYFFSRPLDSENATRLIGLYRTYAK